MTLTNILALSSTIKSLRLEVVLFCEWLLYLFLTRFYVFSILLQASVSHGKLSGNMNLTEVSIKKTLLISQISPSIPCWLLKKSSGPALEETYFQKELKILE